MLCLKTPFFSVYLAFLKFFPLTLLEANIFIIVIIIIVPIDVRDHWCPSEFSSMWRWKSSAIAQYNLLLLLRPCNGPGRQSESNTIYSKHLLRCRTSRIYLLLYLSLFRIVSSVQHSPAMHENVSTKVAVTTSVTPVHGRPEFSKHRNSNHQRNLSLDFRYHHVIHRQNHFSAPQYMVFFYGFHCCFKVCHRIYRLKWDSCYGPES